MQATFDAYGQLLSFSATGGDSGSRWAPIRWPMWTAGDRLHGCEGKQKKTFLDAYGRTIQVVDLVSSGNINTF